ncbi:MAG: hypothetical protein IJ268_06265 [Proteobacteria bacterium]|nr:hypothetical protein [Pseudomonadota bacterium]
MYRCLAAAMMLIAGLMSGCGNGQENGASQKADARPVAQQKDADAVQVPEVAVRKAEDRQAGRAAREPEKSAGSADDTAERGAEAPDEASEAFKAAVREGVESGMNDVLNGVAAPVVAVKTLELDERVVKDIARVGVAEKADDPNVNAHRIDSLDSLSDAQAKLLDSITWDVDPEVLNAVLQENEGQHFMYSDELHPELFYDTIKDMGGTYIGIGSDQGYLFTGWQHPTLAFLVDYDPWIVVQHKVYMAFWRSCEDSACLLRLFDDREAGLAFLTGEAGIAAGLSDKETQKIYRAGRMSVAKRLRAIRKMPQPTFMNDPEMFGYIKNLIETGRLRTFQANLLGDLAFKSVADTLNALGAKVTTLYLSNAEQYWPYSKQFKANMLGLPAAENALIMRTSASKPINEDYRYSVQPMHVFKAWLEHPKGNNVRAVTKRVRVKDAEDFPFTVDDVMPPAGEEDKK